MYCIIISIVVFLGIYTNNIICSSLTAVYVFNNTYRYEFMGFEINSSDDKPFAVNEVEYNYRNISHGINCALRSRYFQSCYRTRKGELNLYRKLENEPTAKDLLYKLKMDTPGLYDTRIRRISISIIIMSGGAVPYMRVIFNANGNITGRDVLAGIYKSNYRIPIPGYIKIKPPGVSGIYHVPKDGLINEFSNKIIIHAENMETPFDIHYFKICFVANYNIRVLEKIIRASGENVMMSNIIYYEYGNSIKCVVSFRSIRKILAFYLQLGGKIYYNITSLKISYGTKWGNNISLAYNVRDSMHNQKTKLCMINDTNGVGPIPETKNKTCIDGNVTFTDSNKIFTSVPHVNISNLFPNYIAMMLVPFIIIVYLEI